MFQWLSDDQWKIKFSKCKCAQRSIAYLGHVISGKGITTDPAKVQAVMDWPQPKTIKDVRGFLGLAGYYQKFIKHFGVIVQPLTALLKKGVAFLWTDSQQMAFQALKQALVSAPCLALSDFSQPFHLETDACATGVGAVLLQNGHPLAYISKALGPRNQGLSTYEKEYLAILVVVDQWRHYLMQGEFFIHTDQKSLIHLNEQRLHTPWQQKVFTKLLGLQYKVIYKQSLENGAADALSHCQSSDQVMALSTVQPLWLTELLACYATDSVAQQLLSKLALDPSAEPHFSLTDGILRYNGRI